jgi:hypothetical protein
MIRDVVAMATARSSLHNRRYVAVADAEPVEVLDYFSRVVELKFAIQLESIGGRRDARGRKRGSWSECPGRMRPPRALNGARQCIRIIDAVQRGSFQQLVSSGIYSCGKRANEIRKTSLRAKKRG